MCDEEYDELARDIASPLIAERDAALAKLDEAEARIVELEAMVDAYRHPK